jgi:hypothetical protein
MKTIKLRTMNRVILACIIICAGIFFFTACKRCGGTDTEIVQESLQVLIMNRMDSRIHVRLYPRNDDNGFYHISDMGGGYNLNELTLLPNSDSLYYRWDEVVFVTGNMNIEPYTLMSNVFDSIHISLTDKDSTIIRFTPENVTRYSENIFSENSTWKFRIIEYNLPTMCGLNPRKAYCYTFVISKDKIQTE